MPHDLAAMQIALRVLSTFTEANSPDPADVESLRQMAQQGDAPIDEIACGVIQTVIRSREEANGLAHTLFARVRMAAREEWQVGTTPRKPAAKETGAHEPKYRTTAS